MDAVCLEAKEILLLGDFNISLLKPHIKWNQLYEIFSLHQLINKLSNTNYVKSIKHKLRQKPQAQTKHLTLYTEAEQLTGCKVHIVK